MKKLILSAAIAAALCTNVAVASDDGPLVGTSSTVNSTVTGNNTNSLTGTNANNLNSTNNNAVSGTNTNTVENDNRLSNTNTLANRNNNVVSNTNDNVNTSANNNRNDNANTLAQNQTQDQHQVANGGNSVATAQGGNSVATAQGGNAAGGSASANGNGSGNSTTINQSYNDVYRERLQVSQAYAPPLTSGIDTCLGSVSGGVQTQIFGLSGGKTVVDENCVKIKKDKLRMEKAMFAYHAPGLGSVVACNILAQDPDFAQAMSAAGKSCSSEPTPPIVVDRIVEKVIIKEVPVTTKEVIEKVVIQPGPTVTKIKNVCKKPRKVVTNVTQ